MTKFSEDAEKKPSGILCGLCVTSAHSAFFLARTPWVPASAGMTVSGPLDPRRLHHLLRHRQQPVEEGGLGGHEGGGIEFLALRRRAHGEPADALQHQVVAAAVQSE